MALSNAGQFKIGNNPPFTAKSINIIYDTLTSEDSGRTDDGVMHINWVIGDGQTYKSIVKLEIEMPPQTSSDASTILKLVQGKIYNITY